jgi:hypothetical protein
VIGTVYKEMKLKPNILDEYVKVALATWASASAIGDMTFDRISGPAVQCLSERGQKQPFSLRQGTQGLNGSRQQDQTSFCMLASCQAVPASICAGAGGGGRCQQRQADGGR